MLRKNEAYRDVFLGPYKVDENHSGEVLEVLLGGACPICDALDDDLNVDDFGLVGEEFEWVCANCHIYITIQTTR